MAVSSTSPLLKLVLLPQVLPEDLSTTRFTHMHPAEGCSHKTAQEKQHPAHNMHIVLIETLLFEMHLFLPLINTTPQWKKKKITHAL